MSEVILHTGGGGYWSNTQRAVRIVNMDLGYISDELDFGELRVYFDTSTWDVEQDGLIYTDRQFERELREFLNTQGLVGKDVSYSEQGMQGDDYVSFDAEKDFVEKWTTAGSRPSSRWPDPTNRPWCMQGAAPP